jgi:hypothetical protein
MLSPVGLVQDVWVMKVTSWNILACEQCLVQDSNQVDFLPDD